MTELSDQAKEAVLILLQQRGITKEEIEALKKKITKAAYRKSRGTNECDYCGESAKSSPVQDEGQRFCSKECLHEIRMLELALELSDEEIMQHAYQIRNGPCPICHERNSNVEVRRHYRIWSALILSRSSEPTHLCCKKCGKKQTLVQCFIV